jgi:N-acetylglutamate synthase-like GNAT family acetyltransferase
MIRIRAATEADLPTLIELVRQFPTPTPSSASELADIVVRKLHDPSAYIFVAEDESGLIGYVSGCRRTALYAGGDTAWIDEILVDPRHRGRSIGGMLMEQFEQSATADDCKLVALATAGAGPFYSKRGYQTKASYYKKYLSRAAQAVAADRREDAAPG